MAEKTKKSHNLPLDPQVRFPELKIADSLKSNFIFCLDNLTIIDDG